MTIQGEIADALVAALSQPAAETAIEGLIATGEVDAEALVSTALKNAKPGGILGVIYPAIEASFEAEVRNIISKYPPSEIVKNVIIPFAQREAKALGG